MAPIELPPQLAANGYRFIKLGFSGERLKIPVEIGWNIFNINELDNYIQDRQKKWDEAEASGKHEELRANGKFVSKRPVFRGRLNNYAYDEPEFQEWLRRGNNYGVTAAGGLIKLESDDIKRWGELGVLELLPETFTVESSSTNRQHFYFEGPEVADSPLKDPMTGEDIGHIRGTGEAGGRGGMVVGPGSLHPHNVRYKVVKDLPIAKLSKDTLDKIKSILCGKSAVISPTEKKHQEKAGTATNHKDPFANVTISDVLGAHHHDFHLEGSQMAGPNPYGHHSNKNGRCLVIEPDDKGFYCFECAQGGGVSRLIAIRAGIMRCDEKGAPTGPAWWDTIRYALKEGLIDEETARAAGLGSQISVTLMGKSTSSKDLLERIKADPRALKDVATLAALAALKTNDPIEFDLLLESIKKAHKALKIDTIHALVGKFIQESEKAAEKPIEAPENIREKARAIAERGDPLKFLVWQAQRNHLGDIDYQKVLICSIISAASLTSNGIQPGGNGEKGSGKSDACAATYHLVPKDRKLDGSLSPMSLFYLQEIGRLKPGMVLFSDDVEYEPIIPIYKRATARFQQGITHFSVSGGKDRKGIELIVPPRMVWWLTSVESVANEQAFDRQYPISTDSSTGHKKRVTTEIAARRARKELRLADDEGIEVAREIIADIFDNGPFKVLIPQAEKAKWLKMSDFRGQEQFWDLVDALVILRWKQHRQDEDGWLIADDRDLIEAKEIFTGHKVAHYANLTEAEALLVGVMSSGRSMTQKELTESLGIAQSTLSLRIKSILAKSAIITEDYDQGKKVYALNSNMNLNADFWKGLDLIELETDSKEAYCSQPISLLQSYCSVIGVPIGIVINNSNRIPSSLLLNLDESMKGICSHYCGRWVEDSIPSSSISPKHCNNHEKPQQEPLLHYNKQADNNSIDSNNDSGQPLGTTIRQSGEAVGDVKADLQRAAERREAEEAHAKEQAAKYTPKGPKSYLEMAGSVPYDTSSLEAEKICRSFRWQLARGMAPRMDALVKDTGYSQEVIESYLNSVPWVRKDDSSPAGIVVYLPVEAKA